MENMDLQPEDVRVPSEDSSPTQAPPDDSLSHQDHTADFTTPADPALLTSIPRSENQYNEDYTDYARQIHNSTHGAWPVAEPFEEWACRRSHHTRYWFYRAWFHHKTLPWDHGDIEYYKSATGYFIDDRPASQWPSTYSRVWGTRGWQLVLSATHSLSIFGHNANNMKLPFVLKRNVLLLKKNVSPLPNNSATHLLPAEAKRDRLWTVWSISASSIKLKPSCRISLSLMSLRYPCFRAYLLHGKNNSSESVGLSAPSIRTVMNFINLTNQTTLPGHSTATSSAPPDHISTTDPISGGTGLPLPLRSMSLNSTSTESQHTLDPPFPTDRPPTDRPRD